MLARGPLPGRGPYGCGGRTGGRRRDRRRRWPLRWRLLPGLAIRLMIVHASPSTSC
ncbi:hypothetical protein [Streptomyces sp. SP2-10]|uniref:hypothetical protein n=1 Tax=Streptomyces sp. SP2-10 TaxID=2873385 RepID=UPI001CA7A11E|nr:hypothetical protein [Streptomyces sp. SP2-10]